MKWKIVYMAALILNFFMHYYIGYKADTAVYWLSGICVCVAWAAGNNRVIDEIWKGVKKGD